MRRIGNLILKILPFAVIAILIIALIASGEDMSVETILSYLPDNVFLAWVFLLFMYALKSVSVIFPIIVLQIAAGMIFPLWSALILNILGTSLAYTIPYFIGKKSGASAAERLMNKYPKMRDAVAFQRKSDWFISFVLRAVSCFPADIVSMYLGAIGISYIPYIIASVVGTLPGLIPATFVGMNVMKPKSSTFIISASVTVVSAIISLIIYYRTRNRK